MINYVLFLWSTVFMMIYLMSGHSGIYVFFWAAIMYHNAHQVAKKVQ